MGLRDSILVQTDDAVLLAHKSQAQKVKELVGNWRRTRSTGNWCSGTHFDSGRAEIEEGKRRGIDAQVVASPPLAGEPARGGVGEVVFVELGADEFGRVFGEWISSQQTDHRRRVFKSIYSSLRNHWFCSRLPSAANHICQSSRGWNGATKAGARLRSPGLYLNS